MKLVRLFTSTQTDTDSTVNSSGGKGHNLIEMKLGGFNVPSGLVIPTEVCNLYRKGDALARTELLDQVVEAVMIALNDSVFPDSSHTLLSVRSGAPVSMPGMMDTILNVGAGYDDADLHEHLQTDCRRRFVEMYADVVMGHEGSIDNHDAWLESITKHIPKISDVIRHCIEAVFNSWDNDRAIYYRQINGIDGAMGTAVVIQSMVFGNFNEQSGSGVYFTRNPESGVDEPFGDFLTDCQGEDVVDGSTTAPPLSEMKLSHADLYEELLVVGKKLEAELKDVQEIEFTIEQGELFILQTRNGKRSALAEIQIALDLLDEGVIEELGERIKPGTFNKLRQPVLPADFNAPVAATGIGSGGYFATGKAAFSVDQVLMSLEDTILVAEETTPDDIKGMERAAGILTTKGGATSHAAVVARGMNKPCVVGCEIKDFNTIKYSDFYVLIDGQTGRVWLSDTAFDIDFNTSLPVDLLAPLFDVAITSDDWVRVESYNEAVSLEKYINKVGVPVEDLTADQLVDLAGRFERVVLINPDRRDRVSNFLGTPNPTEMANARKLDNKVVSADLKNVFFNNGDWVQSNVAKPYKTMADVMNPDFIGYIEKSFMKNVMGDEKTFQLVSKQLGLSARVVDMESALGLLEKRIKIG